MRRFFVLHARMQPFFRAWDRADERSYADAAHNVVDVEFPARSAGSLGDPLMDDDALREAAGRNFALLEALRAAAGRRRR